MATINLVIKNTTSGNLFTHITGRDDKGLCILSSDGHTPYRPTSPSATLQPLQKNSAINVGGPGSSRTVTVPKIFGSRIWFCVGEPLTFYLNPGPALVEPNAGNETDPNFGKDWGFCEFTFNDQQLYVNVSYVDFVSFPIALQLENQSGVVTKVQGMPKDGLKRVAAGLDAQGKRDGAGWEKLVTRKGNKLLRAMSPNLGASLNPNLFNNYFKSHVDAVWDKYRREDLTVDTQFTWGVVKGRVQGDNLVFPAGDGGKGIAFTKPSAKDIFSCSTGPFAGGPGVSEERLNIGARLSAALNRSTLLRNNKQPQGERVETYYKAPITNHYARVCHEVAIGGRGYAFPYDDVGADTGPDQSGFLNDPHPKVLTVTVGGL